MDLQHILHSLRERWRSGLLSALLVLGTVAALALTQTPDYRATSQVYVQVRTGEGIADLNSGASFASQQISSYAELATTPFVLDEVIEELGLEATASELARDLTVTAEEGSFLLEITATSPDPEGAAAVADATAIHLQEAVASLDGGTGASSVELRVVTPAAVPAEPYSPDHVRIGVLGLLLALLAGVATALIRALLNTRVRGVDDLRTGEGRIVLGTIPAVRGAESAARVLLEHPHGAAAEAYRELRTNLQFVELVEGRRSILVTSSLMGEGKSTCTVNLAHALASSGSRVLLIDADLRSPSVHELLGIEGEVGLTTLLIGRAALAEVTQPGSTGGLDVITSGTIPPNPSELLGSAAMEKLLHEAYRRYDVVLIDVPPVLPVADAAVLSRIVGGVLVVAQNERVRRAELERAMAKLQAVDAPVVGMILNRVRGAGQGAYAAYGSYGAPGAEAGAELPAGEGDTLGAPWAVTPRQEPPETATEGESARDRDRGLARAGSRRGHR
ncbi:polysaccharide biosynthesis tyrosine autokinase [Brachybacterium sp. YJGR34]|uniref:polysaccharide biosynthesis tyrosine autokinase n=1 Tax=Brachybacterium sp. YJGR34 TaxID=2059911 RepID=UPI0018E60A24|nr:polysaccharide biosynthesis tyrosine autokinase [Brachybacterium sp. YJGR34]